MPMHDCPPGTCDHYGCKLRQKGVQIGTLATPSRPKKGRLTPTAPQPHLSKVEYDVRPNGTKMPILNPDGSPVRKGQAKQNERKVEEFRRFQSNQQTST